MSTSAKIKASRRNGKKSRGPKSAGGKEISSRNRFPYTIDPSRFITSGEDAAEFRKMAKSVLGQWQPRTEYERMLVHRLIRLLWRLRRLEQMEFAILTGGGDTGLGLPTGFEIPNGEARLEALPRILDLEIKLEAAIRDTERFLWELKQRPLGQDAVAPQKEGEPKQQPIQEVPINSGETLPETLRSAAELKPCPHLEEIETIEEPSVAVQHGTQRRREAGASSANGAHSESPKRVVTSDPPTPPADWDAPRGGMRGPRTVVFGAGGVSGYR